MTNTRRYRTVFSMNDKVRDEKRSDALISRKNYTKGLQLAE